MNLNQLSRKNEYYRRVLYTGKMQLVLMSLKPLQEIGREKHSKIDQFIQVTRGVARVIIDDEDEYRLTSGMAIMVPAGSYHNVINISKTRKLKLTTIYSPAEHASGTLQKNKP